MPDQPEVEVDWENRTPQMRSTLVFIRSEGKVLLIHKKRGLGEGKINGPGGKVEKGESVDDCAVREVQEEVGLTPLEPQAVAELYFQFTDGLSIHCTVYTADEFAGELIETDEAQPFWVPIAEVPYDKMWEDDQLWLPQILNGQFAEGYFTFADDTMLSNDITFTGSEGFEAEEKEADETEAGDAEAEEQKSASEEEESGDQKQEPEEECDVAEDEAPSRPPAKKAKEETPKWRARWKPRKS